MPKKNPHVSNTCSVDADIDRHLLRDSNDFTDIESDVELNQFLEHETQNQYSELETDQELDTFFENEEMPPWKAIRGDGDCVHIGIDTEYVYNEEENRNDILSYQYYLIVGDKSIYDVELTPVAQVIKKCRAENKNREQELKAINKVKNPRKSFDEYLVGILQTALGRGLITTWPKDIYIYAHFLRADIASFKAFWEVGGGKLEVIRNTVASTRGAYGIDVEAVGRTRQRMAPIEFTDKNKKERESRVRFIDTMLLSPGQSGLDAVGELIGIKKENIPAPYRKDRMDDLLVADEALFCRYALRDAEVTVKYGLEMQDFALKDITESLKDRIKDEEQKEKLQFKRLPSTLGNFSVSLFKGLTGDKEKLDKVLGMETREKQYWHQGRKKVINTTETQISPGRKLFEQLAIDCFHGGRNECYMFGAPPIADYNDFDLAGAYTTALVDIKPVDFSKSRLSTNVEDYLNHKMGFAYVKFKFPENTRFPSLPVRTDLYGLYYPLEGISYCTAPEIEVAHNMGCDLDIQFGVIVPWVEKSESVFTEFTALIRDQRQKYSADNDKFREKLWKEIGNTLYGKIGQGLKGKSGFNSSNGRSKEIPHSPVTNPYFAAHATGFVRAVLSEMMANTPDDVAIISATTDGYLTDSTEEQLDLTGPITKRFNEICEKFGDGGMIKHKHHARQIIAMKTRGQITSERGDTEPVVAKAGVKPADNETDENKFMVKLFLDRFAGQKIPNNSLVSARDMYLKEMDLIQIQREKKLNLEFDFKRKPVNPRMTQIRHPESGEMVEHIFFDTVPWKNESEGQKTRALFDGWRLGTADKNAKDQENTNANCLKTMEDWGDWVDYSKSKALLKGTRLNYLEDGSLGVMLKLVLRALAKDKWGISKTINGKKRTHQQLADMFTEAGFLVEKHAINNARNAALYPQVLAAAPKLIPLLDWLLGVYPDMDLDQFFHEEELNDVLTLLENYRTGN
ncbi:DNA polymerase [Vibrio splendidus]|uniref:DNA polymerase n=1 Tax=Vibrio splendidus TaxID=29497 RepID=UPI000D3C03A0|nr:DNA polymerase [Vibrio splendidus]PTP27537.1 DNA-directed DNA polymerase [Vibrio splendidus]